MTLAELKRETLALGFETEFLDANTFIPAVNRSLRNIYNDLSITDTVKLYAEPIVPLTIVDKIRHFGKSTETYPLIGRAWSFEVSGVGSFIIRDGALTRTVNFNTTGEVLRGFLEVGGDITFTGDYSYTVLCLATFEEVTSGEVCDIPAVSKYREFDLRRLRPDFLSFSSYPRNSEGVEITEARMSNGILSLPLSFEGALSVEYKRSPRLVDLDTEDECELDLTHGAEALLPLLVASYVWLSDDAERAQHYRILYDSGIRTLLSDLRLEITAEYVKSNGWA